MKGTFLLGISIALLISCAQQSTIAPSSIELTGIKEVSSLSPNAIVGVGILELSAGFDTYLMKPILRNEGSKTILDFVSKSEDVAEIYKGVTVSESGIDPKIDPRFFNFTNDFFRMTLDCIEVTDQYYVVLINRKLGNVAFFPRKDNRLNFYSFSDYAQRHAESGFEFNPSSNPLRTMPSDEAPIVGFASSSSPSSIFGASKQISYDWMEVEIRDTKEKGWLRWKKGDELLLQFNTGC